MKNIQIIDGAMNCSYDIFAISDHDFKLVFPNGQDIEFIDDIVKRLGRKNTDRILTKVWKKPMVKAFVHGIHGTIFYELNFKKKFYPTRKQSEMVNSIKN